MRRLLPLLCFALLPAAIAAPVPPGKRAEFGANGVITTEELEQVKFDTRPLKPEEREKVGDLPAMREQEDERKPTKPRAENRYDLAVHMPWKHFDEGESIPAYFVLRNNRGHILSLDARLSLFGSRPTIWNSCSIDVRNAKTGKAVHVISTKGWSCGGGGLVDVPADGFYCVKGNLGRTPQGGFLPAGEYEVDWRYGWLRSPPVTFTVGKADGKIPSAVKRSGYRFYKITPVTHDDDEEDSPLRKGDGRLEAIHADEMAAALASREHVLVPDIHTIPKADKLVEAWLEWKPYRDGDYLVVTLRAVPPHKQVSFAEMPHLHLQMEVPDDGHHLPAAEEEKRLAKLWEAGIVTPLTIETRLPAGWRERLSESGTVRVAVLVTSKELEMPLHGLQLKKRLQDVQKSDPDAPPVWQGVLRTEYVELRLPPRLPLKP
jgi:hypothetical protein